MNWSRRSRNKSETAAGSKRFDAPRSFSKWMLFAGILLISGLVVVIYWPSIHGGFVLDDDLLLTDNTLIQGPMACTAFGSLRNRWTIGP